ncbi:MAG: hypothetical protein WCA44_05780 [Acidobacteriaceae bacterium]
MTSVRTRDGINLTMQGLNKSPVTGLIGGLYTPETATQNFLQVPTIFDMAGDLQYENPVGSGRMTPYALNATFTPPANAHAVFCQTYNKIFAAFSNLNTPLSTMAVIDPLTKNVWPYGMKSFGWVWTANTPVLVGEVCTPTAPGGNGHTYICTQAGITGANEPTPWPTAEEGVNDDGTAIWKEYTAVMANRLSPPPTPVLALAGGGTIAAGQDVYVVITLVNSMGESLPSTPTFIETLSANSTVNVPLPTLTLGSLPGWMQELGTSYIPTGCNIYVAIVAHGSPAPALSTYEMSNVTPQALGSTYGVTAAGIGAAPPSFCSARVTPGQLPTPDVQVQIQRVVTGSTVNPPPAPGLSLVGGGSFPTNQDIYVALTLVNANGETTLGAITKITTSGVGGQAVQVSSADNYGPTVTGFYIYEADVGAGSSPPSSYNREQNSVGSYGPFPLGSTQIILAHNGGGPNPPVSNTATLPEGAFAAGRDVYVAQTYTNAAGETTLGPANAIINTNADDAVLVTVAVPQDDNNNDLYDIASVGIYEADVPTGTAAPPSTAFSLVGYYQPTNQPFIIETATGPNPPTVNGTGPGGAIVADTSTGGINETQGYRYAAIMYMNQNYTISGFTPGSIIQYDVDEDGWQLGIFKVAIGPAYVLARIAAFSVADGSNDGPFWWNGNVNLQIPNQNFVYPQTILSDGVNQSATVFLDNVTTNGTFNFTDEYLDNDNDVTDRLDCIWPNQAVHCTYCPSVDRIFQTGVPGYYSGWWVSLAGDPESYYSDLSYISVGSDDGERAWGVIEYRGTVYGLRERSGMTLGANPNNPQAWTATKRWSERGPCGPRAFDACGDFLIFIHRSGIYRYTTTIPELVTKEIPYFWRSINWLAANTICCKIDQEKHEVHILVPIGNSTVPNQEVVLNYLEGWEQPVHFSTFSQKEIAVAEVRKFSINDVQANVCTRIERTLPNPNPFPVGQAGIPFLDSTYFTSQFVYGSSAADGTVQAVTPGTFSDNGAGIDCVYETVAPQTTMALCKIEGFSLNARGNGTLYPYFLAGRTMVTGEVPLGPINPLVIACRPVDLDIMENEGLSRMVPSRISERWRMRFTNGGIPGAWFALKSLSIYAIPMYQAREESELGG